MVPFDKNKSSSSFCYEYNGFCLKFQPSLFPKLETCDFGRKIFKIANFWENISDPIIIFWYFALQIHSNLSKTKMKLDFGYIWKMYIGGSFTKCKSVIPILIHFFLILLNEKMLPFLFSLWFPQTKTIMGLRKIREIFWYNFHVKIIPERL